ncbi:TetR/AcrR family transcriptional regulator [Nocardioides jishulii]|uniref:Helix-turn-helix transcriptional regulator n=1 Tax=Nocardioides jishulii TaxID=2575440 RepID=A0A4U2YMM5_9ACTN|nr:TetR/AcrR family transcriptional regulator [Nocardioides jishulii]QCX27394.1 helix-turn-helix transcriptional regulator [Nocardioides jishulii]TKI62200.1 helix-turn-helix transcriptional regulator [Nocardioides jishulii]
MTVEEVAVRRRPRNRRQLVVDAAGPVFSELGYHGASMEEVAAKVGITAAALYRHFPNKYALFVECANLMVDRLVSVIDVFDEDAFLTDLLPALAQISVEHRASGGTYRWEARFLEPEERRELRAKFTVVVDATAEALEREFGGGRTRLRAAASLGAVGSITAHRTPIARQRAEDLLVAAGLGVAAVDLDDVAPTASRVRLPARAAAVSRRAEILRAAILLFARSGFHHVSMGQIAAAVGVGSSAIYRHYATKADILAAACLQAAGSLEQAVGQALHGVHGAEEQLEALVAAYVAYSFENLELISVAEAEIMGLPPELRRPVVLAQREHVELWEQRLRAVRPDLDARAARTLVHAGFGVVVEAGRQLRWRDEGDNRDVVTALVLGALTSAGPTAPS